MIFAKFRPIGTTRTNRCPRARWLARTFRKKVKIMNKFEARKWHIFSVSIAVEFLDLTEVPVLKVIQVLLVNPENKGHQVKMVKEVKVNQARRDRQALRALWDRQAHQELMYRPALQLDRL